MEKHPVNLCALMLCVLFPDGGGLVFMEEGLPDFTYVEEIHSPKSVQL